MALICADDYTDVQVLLLARHGMVRLASAMVVEQMMLAAAAAAQTMAPQARMSAMMQPRGQTT